jgi:hypothetical protein
LREGHEEVVWSWLEYGADINVIAANEYEPEEDEEANENTTCLA